MRFLPVTPHALLLQISLCLSGVGASQPATRLNMESITFNVQIQADHPRGSRTQKAVALKLCDDINNS
jgi:hypothetical protein